MPEGYTGAIVQMPDKEAEEESIKKAFRDEDREEGGEDTVVETEAVRAAEFGEFMVWDHGQLPDGSSDPYMKGIQEWISFAETV